MLTDKYRYAILSIESEAMKMIKNYEITFVTGLKMVQTLTQNQLHDLIRKYKIRGYKLV